jgi:hypothetical protein
MFFRIKGRYLFGIFVLLALLPFAAHKLFHSRAIYYFLFDWRGVFDHLSSVVLFLALGNFLIIRRFRKKRPIPTVTALVVAWTLLTECAWGMDFTQIRGSDLIYFAGLMTYVPWIDSLSIYLGISYLVVSPVLQIIPAARGRLSELGYPFPTISLYFCLIPIVACAWFSELLPYKGSIVREMPEFLFGLWLFFLSAFEGAGNE